MKKFNYDTGLSAASVACGGTLGPIIPPSVPFIIYGLTAGLSIGTLFISGIVPGLMLSAAFIAYIYSRCRLNPELGPRGETFTLAEKVKSLKAGGPIIILFLLVIGGMYTGVFTPNEGGAIGAFGAFVLGILYRRFSWKSFSQSLLAAGKVIPLVFLIVIGATMFTRFIAWCQLSATMSTFISGLGLAPLMAAAIVLVIFFILGCFIDVLTLLLVGVPTLHPIIVAMGIDPIYFAVLVILIINVGVITPPVGINLFTLKGVAPEIPIGTIYRGVIPFVFATVIVVAVLFFIPPLITWLPGIIHY
jgi:tripartite ATP-independent transporter DctM subunit